MSQLNKIAKLFQNSIANSDSDEEEADKKETLKLKTTPIKNSKKEAESKNEEDSDEETNRKLQVIEVNGDESEKEEEHEKEKKEEKKSSKSKKKDKLLSEKEQDVEVEEKHVNSMVSRECKEEIEKLKKEIAFIKRNPNASPPPTKPYSTVAAAYDDLHTKKNGKRDTYYEDAKRKRSKEGFESTNEYKEAKLHFTESNKKYLDNLKEYALKNKEEVEYKHKTDRIKDLEKRLSMIKKTGVDEPLPVLKKGRTSGKSKKRQSENESDDDQEAQKSKKTKKKTRSNGKSKSKGSEDESESGREKDENGDDDRESEEEEKKKKKKSKKRSRESSNDGKEANDDSEEGSLGDEIANLISFYGIERYEYIAYKLGKYESEKELQARINCAYESVTMEKKELFEKLKHDVKQKSGGASIIRRGFMGKLLNRN